MSERSWMIGLVGVVLGLGIAWLTFDRDGTAPPTDPATLSKTQSVNLKYLDLDNQCAEESTACVEASQVDIWKEWGDQRNKNRPKKVEWFVDNDQTGQYYWEIESKNGADKDYLGPVKAIKCNGSQHTKTKKIARGEGTSDNDGTVVTNDDKWLYKVTVYRCENNQPTDCLCMSDPRVGIRP